MSEAVGKKVERSRRSACFTAAASPGRAGGTVPAVGLKNLSTALTEVLPVWKSIV